MKINRKFAKIAALLAALSAAGVASIVSPTVFINPKVPSEASGKTWMRALDGSKRLSQFSLPGTHNSGARFEPIRGTARCQDFTIVQQLDAGVRLLDIRCRHQNDGFAIYHGPVYQKLSFGDVIGDVTEFLRSHPSETVIVSVQETAGAQDNTRSFEATFAAYVARNSTAWRLDPTIPTLDRARGKIVLLRRFGAANPIGIDASHWPDNSAFATDDLRVQDIYQVGDTDDKWDAVESLLDQTRDADGTKLTLNFASGVQSGWLGVPNVSSVAGDINPRLTLYFADNPRGNFGIIAMDFADDELCAAIYQTNR